MRPHTTHTQQTGFIRIIVVIVLVIALIAWLKIDVRGIVEDPEFQEIKITVVEIASDVWNNIIKGPFVLLLSNIVDFVDGENYFQKFKNEQTERTELPDTETED